ncbi:unnamed protein product [Chondrus crispus]|uniref:Uncharacterized protein n=1 Tax=Chondrus crispus TaxID=2769 RepID=R7QDC0_CHOCR|nr:unnamed protein product [Chondrus crispus]CDF35441.1 unnamed protein product [Chondrus crispus]|eukprot:XP_005715260.1 unnamed protein product [Chondrus crispus]
MAFCLRVHFQTGRWKSRNRLGRSPEGTTTMQMLQGGVPQSVTMHLRSNCVCSYKLSNRIQPLLPLRYITSQPQ